MAIVAMCFNLMQEEAIENLKTFWRNLGCLRKENESKSSKSSIISVPNINSQKFHSKFEEVAAYKTVLQHVQERQMVRTKKIRDQLANQKQILLKPIQHQIQNISEHIVHHEHHPPENQSQIQPRSKPIKPNKKQKKSSPSVEYFCNENVIPTVEISSSIDKTNRASGVG